MCSMYMILVVFLYLEQKDFSGNVESLQVIASAKRNDNTALIRIKETRANITLDWGWFIGQWWEFWPANNHLSEHFPSF